MFFGLSFFLLRHIFKLIILSKKSESVMSFKKGQNPNRPGKGSSIKVEPIRSRAAIKRIRLLIAESPIYSTLFCLGINTAFRASDLLSIRAGDVRDLQVDGELKLRERKTGKDRRVNLNKVCIDEIQKLLESLSYHDDDYLFQGQRGLLTVPSVSRLVKKWCTDAGMKGNYAAHSLRKTWGYHQRLTFGASLPLLVEAFGHATQRQTLDYLGIQPEEIKDLYSNAL
jgi:integrase